jgi:4-hydroxybenzoate polyprenyltransferase
LGTAVLSRSRPVATVANILIALRPKQWTKNGVVFAALVFADKMLDPWLVARAAAAALLFCAISGAVYLVNDMKDLERDRLHPTKKHRPLAAGRLKVADARAATVLLLGVGVPMAWLLCPPFGVLVAAYFAMQLAYSFWLKNIVIMDVLVISAGFVMRAVAGSLVVDVPISPWLYVCTSLLSLFLGFGKRRQELVLLDQSAVGHRKILDEYSAPLLDQLINVVASSTIIAYSLYCFFSETSHKTPYMMLTIPFVLYAVFRYLYLMHGRDQGDSPEEVLFRDRPLLMTIVLWGMTAVLILYSSL